ncbi:membrane protein insertion efficiency factor YidD [Candidatus Pelagibacter sp.]|nr:membrane protein insertion efficiency factor YidD [Candidatus Pelagibacter sp.]
MKISVIITIRLIKVYQYLISPFLGHSCRYLPTCSEYSIEALKTFGFFKGIFISIKRILSCHPMKFLGGGEGFDPVNKKTKMKIKK